MLETQIQGAIIGYLTYRKDITFQRTNNIPAHNKLPGGKIQMRSLPPGQKRGWPDITLCKEGKFIGLEVKTQKGRQTEAQKEVEKQIKAAGGEYYIVRSVEDVIEVIG